MHDIQHANAAPDAPAVLRLPEELTIYTVGELRTEWLNWVASARKQGGPTEVDGGAVADLDAAGVQLLLALSHSLAGAGSALHLTTPSDVLQAACRTLGLERLLARPAAA